MNPRSPCWAVRGSREERRKERDSLLPQLLARALSGCGPSGEGRCSELWTTWGSRELRGAASEATGCELCLPLMEAAEGDVGAHRMVRGQRSSSARTCLSSQNGCGRALSVCSCCPFRAWTCVCCRVLRKSSPMAWFLFPPSCFFPSHFEFPLYSICISCWVDLNATILFYPPRLLVLRCFISVYGLSDSVLWHLTLMGCIPAGNPYSLIQLCDMTTYCCVWLSHFREDTRCVCWGRQVFSWYGFRNHVCRSEVQEWIQLPRHRLKFCCR